MATLLTEKMVEEPYSITQSETGITARDVAVGDNRDEWQELYRYQVPVGIAYAFHPRDTFSLYGEYLSDGVDVAFADDGGVYTDETTANNDATTGDITLLPATETTSDNYYGSER